MSRADDTGVDDGERSERQGPPQYTPRPGEPQITAQQSDGSHTVFTESGTSTAWIATDYVVDLQR